MLIPIVKKIGIQKNNKLDLITYQLLFSTPPQKHPKAYTILKKSILINHLLLINFVKNDNLCCKIHKKTINKIIKSVKKTEKGNTAPKDKNK